MRPVVRRRAISLLLMAFTRILYCRTYRDRQVSQVVAVQVHEEGVDLIPLMTKVQDMAIQGWQTLTGTRTLNGRQQQQLVNKAQAADVSTPTTSTPARRRARPVVQRRARKKPRAAAKRRVQRVVRPPTSTSAAWRMPRFLP